MTSDEARSTLDEGNSKLLERIEKLLPVEFLDKGGTEYNSVIRKSNPIHAEVWFYTPLSQEKLAHELLHVHLASVLGDCSCLLYADPTCIFTTCLFTEQFCTDLLNQSEHVITYPLYLKMGYEPLKFVESIKDAHDSEYQLILLHGVQRNGVYSSRNVDCFIRLCVYYLFFTIDNRFKQKCKALKDIDKTLYQVVENYHSALKTITIKPQNRNKLQNIYKSFRNNLTRWYKNHNVRIIN